MTPDLTISPDLLAATDERPVAMPRTDAVLRVEGPGAVDCVQGIFTNEAAKGALPLLRWGAALTPKGMIVSDFWLLRTAAECWLVVPAAGVEAIRSLLARSFPPRLARVRDLSDELAAWWLKGTGAPLDAVGAAPTDGPAPFDRLVLLPRDRATEMLDATGRRLLPAGVGDVRAALLGYPTLGREIDEKTLPQEVRFDELHGVRYDKGCYVGQETVARLHFRGHPNRTLRAMTGAAPLPDDSMITTAEGREVGTVATLVEIGNRWLASARLRREVPTGDTVREFPVDASLGG